MNTEYGGLRSLSSATCVALSRSQAGQDRFVHTLLPKNDGTFLEIGCCHPIERSNTFALEQLGWTGLQVDNDPGAVKLCIEQRRGPVVEGDSTKLHWREVLSRFAMPSVIDYLSLDVDAASLASLQALPLDAYRFRVITIEHDAYRFGPGPRDMMRQLLLKHGYHLVAGNVKDQGMAFEDWWIDRGAVEMTAWAPFHSDGREWQELFPS